MLLLVAIVAVALAFDFTNGFHDSANAIACSISTRALSPRIALLMAAALQHGRAPSPARTWRRPSARAS